jgi:hypothetical protein
VPASFAYGQLSLDFAIEGRPARAVIKYKYFASEKRIEYVSMDCTDPGLKERIESDPAMREKVDTYVKKMLAKRDEGLS